MLKGHVFKEQIFGHQIFALFINTFLNGKNGVSNNYKNGMQVTYSGNTLTIQSGAVCIQGRFLEEDTSTDIVAGTDVSYCKLVIEIDLDKQNTETQLSQASYKIVKSTSGYPKLTQNDIVKNNAGVYQYELARFRTNSNGITNFLDMRTFLDFDSIYDTIQTQFQSVLDELEEELASVEDGSAYILKNNIAIIKGNFTLNPSSSGSFVDTSKEINLPNGFTYQNCSLISFGSTINQELGYSYDRGVDDALSLYQGAFPKLAVINNQNKISIKVYNKMNDSPTYYYKIILYKE